MPDDLAQYEEEVVEVMETYTATFRAFDPWIEDHEEGETALVTAPNLDEALERACDMATDMTCGRLLSANGYEMEVTVRKDRDPSETASELIYITFGRRQA